MKHPLFKILAAVLASITVMSAQAKVKQSDLDELNTLTPIYMDEQTEITNFFADDFGALSARVEMDIQEAQIPVYGDMIAANRKNIRQSVCASPLGQTLTEKHGLFKYKYYSTGGKYIRAVIFSCP